MGFKPHFSGHGLGQVPIPGDVAGIQHSQGSRIIDPVRSLSTTEGTVKGDKVTPTCLNTVPHLGFACKGQKIGN